MGERFKGKIVIVTGSASGIGEATTRRFVAEGAKVALVAQQGVAGKGRQESARRPRPKT